MATNVAPLPTSVSNIVTSPAPVTPPLINENIDLNHSKFDAWKKRKQIGIPLSAIAKEMKETRHRFTAQEIAAFTGIPVPTKKRYDEEIKNKKQKYKTFVKDESKICINVIVVEMYLKSLQHNKDSSSLFSIIPWSVIHVCYKYCRLFKEYLILLYERNPHKYGDQSSIELKMLSLKDYTTDFEIRNTNLSKKIKHFVMNPAVQKPQILQNMKHNYNYHAGVRRHNVFISHLYLSKQVMQSMHEQIKQPHAEHTTDKDIYNRRRMYCCVFESHLYRMNRDTGKHPYVENIRMLYFNSPYFYDYDATQKQHTYNYYVPPTFINVRQHLHTQKLFNIPQSNHLLRLSAKYIKVLDLYNMKWLETEETKDTGSIKMHHESRINETLCLLEDKLFIIGGSITSRKITRSVEYFDCSQLKNMDCTQRMSTVLTTSELNISRTSSSCDIMDVKNMIVIGGGSDDNIYYNCDKGTAPASNTIEFYDPSKDKWFLQKERTKQQHFNPKLWCSGNLVFMVGNNVDHGQNVSSLNQIEFMDIRGKVWTLLDNKNVEKLFDFYTTKHLYRYKHLGTYI